MTANNVQMHAEFLRGRGLALCRIDPADKRPGYVGWSTRSLEPSDFAPGDLMGIMGGPLSDAGRPGHALVIIDLDTVEALALADKYLPATTMTEGRPGKLRSHRYFLVRLDSIPEWGISTADQAAPAAIAATGHAGPFTKSFRHRETNAEVIRAIGTGGQAVCPPSLHPSGEPRTWQGGRDHPGDPAVVDFRELWDAVGRLASACGAAVPRVIESKPETSRPFYRRPGEARPVTRAAAYLNKLPGAISDQGGHSQTFWAARALVTGFRLSAETALRLLLEHWNQKCQPPWSEKELRHKVEDASNLPFGKPDGWLLAGNYVPLLVGTGEGRR